MVHQSVHVQRQAYMLVFGSIWLKSFLKPLTPFIIVCVWVSLWVFIFSSAASLSMDPSLHSSAPFQNETAFRTVSCMMHYHSAHHSLLDMWLPLRAYEADEFLISILSITFSISNVSHFTIYVTTGWKRFPVSNPSFNAATKLHPSLFQIWRTHPVNPFWQPNKSAVLPVHFMTYKCWKTWCIPVESRQLQ